jgi:hypothetical protein
MDALSCGGFLSAALFCCIILGKISRGAEKSIKKSTVSFYFIAITEPRTIFHGLENFVCSIIKKYSNNTLKMADKDQYHKAR